MNLPVLVSLQLQNEHVDIVVVRGESLRIGRREVRIRPDHAAEFRLEEGEEGVDLVDVFVRTEESERASFVVDVGPDDGGFG